MPRKIRAAEDRSTSSRRAQARKVQLPGYQGRLYVPKEHKDPAFDYRWVRTHSRNQPDQNNVRDYMNRGWSIVPRSERPDFSAIDTTAIFGAEQSSGIIDAGGLVYMKRAKAIGIAEREAIRLANIRAIQSVRRDQMDPHADRNIPAFDDSQTRYSAIQDEGDFKRE